MKAQPTKIESVNTNLAEHRSEETFCSVGTTINRHLKTAQRVMNPKNLKQRNVHRHQDQKQNC